MTTPLLLLHGAIGAQSQFEPLVAALEASAEIPIHTLDFEGHGTAPDAGRPFRARYFIENILDYLDANGIEQVDLFGHSMGGYVSLLLAAQQPQRVRRVMTLGVKIEWTPEVAARELGNFNPDKILEKVPRFAQMLIDRHGESWWRENLAKSAECTHNLGTNPVVTPEVLAAITQLTIVSIGDRDNLTTLDETARAAKTIPNGALQVFPNTRHPLEMIDTAMLAGAIIHFFSAI